MMLRETIDSWCKKNPELLLLRNLVGTCTIETHQSLFTSIYFAI